MAILKKEAQVLNTLLAKQVDGIIFMGNNLTDELRAQFARAKTPIVLAGSVDAKMKLKVSMLTMWLQLKKL